MDAPYMETVRLCWLAGITPEEMHRLAGNRGFDTFKSFWQAWESGAAEMTVALRWEKAE